MRVDQTSAPITHQKGLEDTVAAHGGQIVGEQHRPIGISNLTAKGDEYGGPVGHEA